MPPSLRRSWTRHLRAFPLARGFRARAHSAVGGGRRAGLLRPWGRGRLARCQDGPVDQTLARPVNDALGSACRRASERTRHWVWALNRARIVTRRVHSVGSIRGASAAGGCQSSLAPDPSVPYSGPGRAADGRLGHGAARHILTALIKHHAPAHARLPAKLPKSTPTAAHHVRSRTIACVRRREVASIGRRALQQKLHGLRGPMADASPSSGSVTPWCCARSTMVLRS